MLISQFKQQRVKSCSQLFHKLKTKNPTRFLRLKSLKKRNPAYSRPYAHQLGKILRNKLVHQRVRDSNSVIELDSILSPGIRLSKGYFLVVFEVSDFIKSVSKKTERKSNEKRKRLPDNVYSGMWQEKRRVLLKSRKAKKHIRKPIN